MRGSPKGPRSERIVQPWRGEGRGVVYRGMSVARERGRDGVIITTDSLADREMTHQRFPGPRKLKADCGPPVGTLIRLLCHPGLRLGCNGRRESMCKLVKACGHF
jgi:hypothetical protein